VAARRKTLGFKAFWPGFIAPALASSVDKVPGGERWIHEIKFDGYRVQVHIQNGQVKVFTRRGNDWTKRFRKIAAEASEIDAGSFLGAPERAERQIDQNRACRLRPALSERS
jgi:bifunctional non-homologous end joining protein LigD